jgi:hypothetical protein
LGALTVAAGVETVGAGVVLIVVVPRVGTGGITIRDASVDFFAVDFFAVDFLAVGFLAEDFLAEDFLATDFLAADFLAAGFFAPDFLATDFFFVATLTPSNLEVSLTSPAESLLSPG